MRTGCWQALHEGHRAFKAQPLAVSTDLPVPTRDNCSKHPNRVYCIKASSLHCNPLELRLQSDLVLSVAEHIASGVQHAFTHAQAPVPFWLLVVASRVVLGADAFVNTCSHRHSMLGHAVPLCEHACSSEEVDH